MTETTLTKTTAANSLTQDERQAMTYTPLGEQTPITLTLKMIAHDIATPTKKGALPSEGDCLRFMNLCKGRELNPWTGDCFMIGFDSNNGPSFELITSYQALLKRSERSPNFDGLEGGIVVKVGDKVEHRAGSLLMPGDTLIGGWSKAYRSDRRIPHESVVDLKTYSTGRSRWGVDPAGMILKVAKAAVLREAFPNTVGGLYVQEEMEHVRAEAEVMQPARIERVVEDIPLVSPVIEKAKKARAKKAAKPEPDAVLAVDWAKEFKELGVTDEAVQIRQAATQEERADVLKTVKSMVDEQQYNLLGKYVSHKDAETRKGVTA